jgi:hypothetical protein
MKNLIIYFVKKLMLLVKLNQTAVTFLSLNGYLQCH